MADDDMDVDGDGSTSGSGAIDWSAPFDELDAEDPNSETFGSRDCVLFTIDLSKNMYLPSDDKGGDSALKKTLKAVRSTIISKIWSSPLDYVGIMLYNTTKKSGTTFEHVFVYKELHQPGEGVVTLVDKLMELTQDQIKAEYGISDKASMADLFWAASSLFAQVQGKLASRRIILFTAEDEPHRAGPNAANLAIQKAADVAENNVTIVTLPVATAGKKFDKDKFWLKVEMNASADETPRVQTVADQWTELTSQVRKRVPTKRVLGRVPLVFGNGLEFYVGIYNTIRTATKPTPIKLYRETNQQAVSETITLEKEGASVLMKTDILKSMQFAGKKLYFTNEEISSMKSFGSPGLKIIGFKPTSFLKPKYHVRSAQFAYPDETLMKGSTKLFIALHKKCLEKDVLAVCQFIPRDGIAPKLIAMCACEEQRDSLGVQKSPPGFNLIFLPFADDFRRGLPLYRKAPVAEENAIEVARALVKKLTRAYEPEEIQNPALQKHLMNIEALALNYSRQQLEDEMPENTTIPDQKGMEKKANKEISQLKELVYSPGYDPLGSKPKPKKRAAPTNGDAAPRKKGPVKKEADADGGAEMDDLIKLAAEAGTLKKFTVAQLKDYCKVHHIKAEGTKKDDLMGAIETHLAGND